MVFGYGSPSKLTQQGYEATVTLMQFMLMPNGITTLENSNNVLKP